MLHLLPRILPIFCHHGCFNYLWSAFPDVHVVTCVVTSESDLWFNELCFCPELTFVVDWVIKNRVTK